MIRQNVICELKAFVAVVSNPRSLQKNILSPQLIRTSLVLLEELPAARQIVLEFFSRVFDTSVANYIVSLRRDPKVPPTDEEYLNDVQEALQNLAAKGPVAWSPLIASWSLELVGVLSHKYSPGRQNVTTACNYWLNCSTMRCLLGLVASCFRRMTHVEAEACVATLLATFTRYSPSFDWVVARLGGCFPLKIVSQIFQCGLKRFSEDGRYNFTSEIGILSYLSFEHEKDLKKGLIDLCEDGFHPKVPLHFQIIPYLLQLAKFSELLLQHIVSVFLDMFDENLIEVIMSRTSMWMQNLVFREMQPSFNNVLLNSHSNGVKLLLKVAKIAERYSWCHDFLECTLQELEQLVLKDRICPLLTNLADETSKTMMWQGCMAANFLEQQTAVRLILLVSAQHPHIYHQTISELLVKSYEMNRLQLGAIIRILGGLCGTPEFPEIKPGLRMLFERILLQQQFNRDQQEGLNAIKNLLELAKLEKASNTSPHLKFHPVATSLIECLPNILNLLSCTLHQVSAKIDQLEVDDKFDELEVVKKIKREEGDGKNIQKKFNKGDVVHELMQLLNSIDLGPKQNTFESIEVLKLSNLTVKYFFWSLTERSPTKRTIATNCVFSLLQSQCSNRKAARMACLRALVEGAIYFYPNLFGSRSNIDKTDYEKDDIYETEKLSDLNRKTDHVTNANRSVLHAGIIGKGLKSDFRDLNVHPDPELQALFLKAIDSCCLDADGNSIDGYSTVSLLLVEMVSSDVMYNGLPFPEEEFTKVTMERDLQIRRTFRSYPILWSIVSIVATHRPALCFSSVLLRGLCASFLHQWRAKNVSRSHVVNENDELLLGTQKLLEILSLGQLLPPPLSYLHTVIVKFEAPEIALILKECVWNYLKDHVPSPALFQCDKKGLHWRNPAMCKPAPQYVDTLRNIMQKKLPKLGSYYYQMFAMPSGSDTVITLE